MKKQSFAALTFAGALAAWSINAKAGITVEPVKPDTMMDFVLQNQTSETMAGVYVSPHGAPRGANRLWGLVIPGQSRNMQFSCSSSPSADYDLVIVYIGHEPDEATWNLSRVEKVCPCIDKAGHRYIEMTLRAERSFTLPGPVPDMSDWF